MTKDRLAALRAVFTTLNNKMIINTNLILKQKYRLKMIMMMMLKLIWTQLYLWKSFSIKLKTYVITLKIYKNL